MPEESSAANQFLLIGERTNVTGSPRFAKLILATATTKPRSRSRASRSKAAPTSST